MSSLYSLLFLLALSSLYTPNPATHYVAGKAVNKANRALQTRLKTTTHRKDYIAKLAKNKKTPKIGPIGDPSAKFRNVAPKNWIIKTAKNSKGTKYINPKNSTDYIRFSSKNMDPRAPLGQKVDYFQRHCNGKVLTRSGQWVNPKMVNPYEFHIPQSKYDEIAHLLNLK